MALRKVSIPTLRNQVGILTLRRAILEWYRFLLCAEHIYILRKTIEGYLVSVPSLTFNTIKTKLIIYVFHSSRYLQSKWMLYFSHAAMV